MGKQDKKSDDNSFNEGGKNDNRSGGQSTGAPGKNEQYGDSENHSQAPKGPSAHGTSNPNSTR